MNIQATPMSALNLLSSELDPLQRLRGSAGHYKQPFDPFKDWDHGWGEDE